MVKRAFPVGFFKIDKKPGIKNNFSRSYNKFYKYFLFFKFLMLHAEYIFCKILN